MKDSKDIFEHNRSLFNTLNRVCGFIALDDEMQEIKDAILRDQHTTQQDKDRSVEGYIESELLGYKLKLEDWGHLTIEETAKKEELITIKQILLTEYKEESNKTNTERDDEHNEIIEWTLKNHEKKNRVYG